MYVNRKKKERTSSSIYRVPLLVPYQTLPLALMQPDRLLEDIYAPSHGFFSLHAWSAGFGKRIEPHRVVSSGSAYPFVADREEHLPGLLFCAQ